MRRRWLGRGGWHVTNVNDEWKWITCRNIGRRRVRNGVFRVDAVNRGTRSLRGGRWI